MNTPVNLYPEIWMLFLEKRNALCCAFPERLMLFPRMHAHDKRPLNEIYKRCQLPQRRFRINRNHRAHMMFSDAIDDAYTLFSVLASFNMEDYSFETFITTCFNPC